MKVMGVGNDVELTKTLERVIWFKEYNYEVDNGLKFIVVTRSTPVLWKMCSNALNAKKAVLK